MARNYSLPTVKTLFAEASECAHPECHEPLTFREKNRITVVAEIAHIRSESSSGPRYDPGYAGDLNGPENLLLLCGKHHKPVDRHEDAYSIPELESWKSEQVKSANGGTRPPAAELQRFVRLSDDERKAMTDIARASERLRKLCKEAQQEIDRIRGHAENERLQQFARSGIDFSVDNEGNRTRASSDNYLLPKVERDKWDDLVRKSWQQREPAAEKAMSEIHEEVAVLRMISESLDPELEGVLTAAQSQLLVIGDGERLAISARQLSQRVNALWRAANYGSPSGFPE